MNYQSATSDYHPVGQASVSQFGDGGFEPYGDYYFEEEQVKRSVTIHHYASPLADFDAFDPFSGFQTKPGLHPVEMEKPQPEDSIRELAQPRFADATHPPDVPFGGVARTSFRLGVLRSAEAFRALHNFLQADLAGLVTKTSLAKCAVTAEIFLELGGHVSRCEVKGRLFRSHAEEESPTESCHLVVELTRRSGDAVAFAEVFRRAVASLGEARPSEQSETFAVPLEVPLEDTQCMQPLVDMVLTGTSPECQAEGLAAMLALTKSPEAVAELYTACVNLQSILLHLAVSPLLQISYLATRLDSWRNVRACGHEASAAAFEERGMALGLELSGRAPAVA